MDPLHNIDDVSAPAVQPVGFNAVFDAAPTPYLLIAPPEWTIVAANKARLWVTGMSLAEQIGRRLFDVFPDDPNDPDADGVRNLSSSLERVVRTRIADVMKVQRYYIRDADGCFEGRWWSPVNSPVLGDDEAVALIIHQVEDVTEAVRLRGEAEVRDRFARDQQAVIDNLSASQTALRASEERLRASEEFSARILASSADCIKVLGNDARLEFMSEGGMCVMEVDDFSAVHGSSWPDFWPGEGHGRALAAVETALRGGVGRCEGFATTMKGTPRWWDVVVTPILGADAARKSCCRSRATSQRRSGSRLRCGRARSSCALLPTPPKSDCGTWMSPPIRYSGHRR